jgi:ATP-dependent DNA helicase DinG
MHDPAATIENILGPDGALERISGFAYRSQQHAMAGEVLAALEDRHHLFIEAPTGVGKTLAYLIPSIVFALKNERKAIVSTHTKNLQEQILYKDIPLCRELLGTEFSAVLLKGRRNYLCTTRLDAALASRGSLFPPEESDELNRITVWAEATPDGDMSGLGFTPSPAVWGAVCSEPGVCTSQACGTRCFFQRAKERARKADVLIVNHALFFSLMPFLRTEDQFLFPGDFVIFDEAHTLEAVAAEGLGGRLSRRGMLSTLHRLYNPRTKRGLLSGAKRQVKSAFKGMEELVDTFFDTVALALPRSPTPRATASRDATQVRIKSPGLVADVLSLPLSGLIGTIADAESDTGDAALAREIGAARESLEEDLRTLEDFLTFSSDRHAYWVEVRRPPQDNVTLCMVPFHVGPSLEGQLFGAHGPVILTSATLSIDGDMRYVQERLGGMSAHTCTLDSPFDLYRQMRIWIAEDMPEPESPDYARELPSALVAFIRRSQGKALVLFTSAAAMQAAAREVADALADDGIRLLVQGTEYSRHDLLDEFKRDIHSVLFGLDSFWMGVDVPGEALEHVIITRLPFAVPTHPLIEARLEDVERRGERPFFAYSLPEAALKLRQGAGRLIRTVHDRGVVSILDSRIVRRGYGKVLLDSLPRCPVDLIARSGESRPLERDI